MTTKFRIGPDHNVLETSPGNAPEVMGGSNDLIIYLPGVGYCHIDYWGKVSLIDTIDQEVVKYYLSPPHTLSLGESVEIRGYAQALYIPEPTDQQKVYIGYGNDYFPSAWRYTYATIIPGTGGTLLESGYIDPNERLSRLRHSKLGSNIEVYSLRDWRDSVGWLLLHATPENQDPYWFLIDLNHLGGTISVAYLGDEQ